MFRKVNTKTLIILFASLLLVVILVNLSDSKRGNRSFKGNLTEYEADRISKIAVYPKAMQGKKVELTKENDQWLVTAGNQKFRADQNLVQSAINGLNKLTPESVVSNKKERWDTYEVSDSLGTRICLYSREKPEADLIFGKVSFSSEGSRSYFRLTDDHTIYRINGSQATEFNRNLNGFKDKTVIRSTLSDWEKLTFSYPADSSFILARNGEKWEIAGQVSDSAKVARFLNTISHVSHDQLAGNNPQGLPLFRLTIEGEKMDAPVELKGYRSEDTFLVSSSQNPDVYFEGKTLQDKLFPPRSKFAKTE